MEFQEEVQQLDGKPQNKSKCIFCTDYNDVITDIVKEAYRVLTGKTVKLQDQSTCIHKKDTWLLNTNKTIGFIYRSLEDHVKTIEDMKDILLDDEKRQSLFMKFREQMCHYCSSFDIYQDAVKADKIIQDDWHEAEATRRDDQTKKDAVSYYNKAEECVNLTKDFIKSLDFTE